MVGDFVKGLFNRNRELIAYCIIGCSGTGMDFVIYTVLTGTAGMHYQLANFLSVSIGIINNFFWNCYFNFKTTDRIWRRFVSFYSIGMLGWSLSAGCLWLFIECLGVNPILAKLSTIFFATVVQFSMNKFITFRKPKNIGSRRVNHE